MRCASNVHGQEGHGLQLSHCHCFCENPVVFRGFMIEVSLIQETPDKTTEPFRSGLASQILAIQKPGTRRALVEYASQPRTFLSPSY